MSPLPSRCTMILFYSNAIDDGVVRARDQSVSVSDLLEGEGIAFRRANYANPPPARTRKQFLIGGFDSEGVSSPGVTKVVKGAPPI